MQGRPTALLLDAADVPSTTPTRVSVAADWNLSKRQSEVMARVIAGDTNKSIATRIEISVSMVEQHLAAIFRKAGVSSRHELIALHWRLTSGGP